uniref:Uncharacterized protein n=2 Tax=Chrysotila carterae TaxID=13221 RepID=A0A7S4F874_CHRCT
MITAIVVTAGIESLQHVAATCQVLRRIVQGEDASEQLARALYPASTLRDVSTETWRERLVNDNKHKCVRAVEMRAVCNWVHNDAEGSFYQNRVVRARLDRQAGLLSFTIDAYGESDLRAACESSFVVQA